MQIEGGCHCGAVTFRAEADPEKVRMCHCTDCQANSGTAFRTVIHIPEEDFTLLGGETRAYHKTAESGMVRALVFCPECGTHLYGASEGAAKRVLSVRVGTIKQRDRLKPRLQVWHRSAQDWVDDIASIPKVETTP